MTFVVRAISVVITVVVVGSMIDLRPFSASPEAIEAVVDSPEVSIDDETTSIKLRPANEAYSTGLIFQPGARVDPRAYVPILSDIADAGYLVVIVKQPFDIGFAAVNAPAGIFEDHPEIDHWALGGHSLGGVAASPYAEDHTESVSGVLLWASYPLGSLADTDLTVTSVSGTEDGWAHPPTLTPAGSTCLRRRHTCQLRARSTPSSATTANNPATVCRPSRETKRSSRSWLPASSC